MENMLQSCVSELGHWPTTCHPSWLRAGICASPALLGCLDSSGHPREGFSKQPERLRQKLWTQEEMVHQAMGELEGPVGSRAGRRLL